jgi:hypothetical protein
VLDSFEDHLMVDLLVAVAAAVVVVVVAAAASSAVDLGQTLDAPAFLQLSFVEIVAAFLMAFAASVEEEAFQKAFVEVAFLKVLMAEEAFQKQEDVWPCIPFVVDGADMVLEDAFPFHAWPYGFGDVVEEHFEDSSKRLVFAYLLELEPGLGLVPVLELEQLLSLAFLLHVHIAAAESAASSYTVEDHTSAVVAYVEVPLAVGQGFLGGEEVQEHGFQDSTACNQDAHHLDENRDDLGKGNPEEHSSVDGLGGLRG